MGMHKRPILKKLGLSKKFLKAILYARWPALGVELIKPSTYLVMSTLKQYIGSYRIQSNASEIIQAIEELTITKQGYTIQPIKITKQNQYW